MTVSNRSLIMLADALRQRRTTLGTKWRRLPVGRQALLVVAHLRKGEIYADLARGFAVGTTTVHRYLREGIDVLAALAPTLDQAITVPAAKAFVTLDGTLLRIDRVGMTAGRDRPYYSGKHKAHGVTCRCSPTRPGGWSGPPRPCAAPATTSPPPASTALNNAKVATVADTGYQGAGPAVRVPQRRRRVDPDTDRYRRLSNNQKAVNTAHARQRGPGERANAQLKSWKVPRQIRCCPLRATALVQAVLVLILTD
jgi:hypothetical protein